MRVLILVPSFPPVLESAGRLYSQLAESLVAAGHAVTVISEHPAAGLPVQLHHPYFETCSGDALLNGVRVRRVSPLTFLGNVPGGKAARFFLSGILFAARGMLLKRHEVVLVYSPPLFMGISGWLLSLRHRAPMVLNVQDIHPKVLFDSGAIRHPWFRAILTRMESLNYRHADAFIVYSAGNRDYLQTHAVRGSVHIIPNWVDTAEVGTVAAGNAFRDEEGIGSRLLLSYAGTMQSAQGLDIVVAAAELLREHSEIIFFLAGEGSAKAELERLVREKQLTNVLIRPVMPADRYIRCLQASDICLVTLGPEVPLETVPGKLAYTMACGKPVLAAVKVWGDAAKILRESESGVCVSPGDAPGFAEAVLALSKEPARRQKLGHNAAHYAQQHFSREMCTRAYGQVLLGVTARDTVDCG